MHSRDHVLPVVRADAERVNPHPVYQAFMEQDYSENFSRDQVRDRVIPTYMGLVRKNGSGARRARRDRGGVHDEVQGQLQRAQPVRRLTGRKQGGKRSVKG